MFSDHNRAKLEISTRKAEWENLKHLYLNDMFVNIHGSGRNQKRNYNYFGMNDSENTAHQCIWELDKAAPKRSSSTETLLGRNISH